MSETMPAGPYKFQKPTDVPFFPTPEQTANLTRQNAERTQAALNFAQYWTPELPEVRAQEIYERLMDAEHRLAAPTGSRTEYDDGVAVRADEMALLEGNGRFLLTTEHATTQRRLYGDERRSKAYEPGLAALGALLYEDTGASHLTMLGRQTGDPNSDPRHPFKDRITDILRTDARKDAFASLHGAAAGLVSELDDARAIDVLIGIGSQPTESSAVMAERVRAIADDLTLRAGVNEAHITFDKKDPLTPRLNPDGTVKRINFTGGGNTTRQHAENVGGEGLAALQIEYSSFLRLATAENRRDYKSRYIGAYLGYTLLRRVVEIDRED